MTAPDVVFPVRVGELNEELRYALRTLCCLPHGRVWLAGHSPKWVEGCGHIPNAQRSSKHENSLRNILAACRHPEVSEEFLLWNDDIFLLEALDEVPVLHRGTMSEYLEIAGPMARSPYYSGVRITADILRRLGHEDPLCYELHVPMPMTKSGVLEAYRLATSSGMPRIPALQLRSLYGNHAGIGGRRIDDVKVFYLTDVWEGGPFLSTVDAIWGRHAASREVMRLFDEPGPYERS